MKILVVGASRGIGHATTRALLRAGHKVRAIARQPSSLTHPFLTWYAADALDSHAMHQVAAGVDVVISCLGTSPTNSPVHLFSESTGILLHAMREQAVERLIIVSCAGVGDDERLGGWWFNWVVKPLRWRTLLADKVRQEALVAESDVQWLIVRPAFLTRRPAMGIYRVTENRYPVHCHEISRADVAHFLVAAAEKRYPFRRTVVLTY